MSEIISSVKVALDLRKLLARLRQRRSRKTWSDVLKLLDGLFTKMNSEPFHPDVVVGVGREGSIVASIFAFNWRLKPYCVLERNFVVQGGRRLVEIVDTVPKEVVRGRKVLVIDCEINTGQTMATAKDFLFGEKSACEVRTMALARSITSTFKADYEGYEYLERPYWPWEHTEEIKLIRHKYRCGTYGVRP